MFAVRPLGVLALVAPTAFLPRRSFPLVAAPRVRQLGRRSARARGRALGDLHRVPCVAGVSPLPAWRSAPRRSHTAKMFRGNLA
jgi:hypothetical protein